ncbi:hypothetical protein [Alkalihalobacterium sp. APHAB7]|uniref:hypothetical protein n=1 Tax=Alkalihalobacterium sp. APHAB7 TaxID=3402081 RepID=UPI003AB0F26D
MKYFILLLIMSVSVACSNATTEKETVVSVDDGDIVAIVKGEEITLKDIRSLYNVPDEKIAIMVKNFVKEEIMVLEAKKLGIDVSGEMEGIELAFPFDDTENEDFFENQAEYLNMTSREYYDVYFKERLERNAYVNNLVNEVLDLSQYGVDDTELLDEKINEYINGLLNEYKEEIEILL